MDKLKLQDTARKKIMGEGKQSRMKAFF